jgi:hypothetical protein
LDVLLILQGRSYPWLPVNYSGKTVDPKPGYMPPPYGIQAEATTQKIHPAVAGF